MSIINECMIVNLQLGLWLGYRQDKDAAKAVTAMANADEDAARVNKHIVPKSSLAPINRAATAIRTHFYTNTMPWKDNGDRLLTRKRYMTFIEEHERLVTTMLDEVDVFLTKEYAGIIQKAEFRMGDLFKPEDYPSAADLRRKFHVNLDIDPVTDMKDIRVRLTQIDNSPQMQKRVAEVEAAAAQRINKAMADVWQRLADVVGHFAKKMGNEDEIFRNTTITNLREIIDLIPDLNVLNDPNLDRIIAEVNNTLATYEPDELRQNPATRQTAALEANKIMEDMAGFMKAFGGQ
jgi:hypothetical protein